MKERIKVLEATVQHLKGKILELEELRREWPTEDRIDPIGQNGNTGEHYAKIDNQLNRRKAMPRVISKNKPGGPKTTKGAKNKPKKKGTKKS